MKKFYISATGIKRLTISCVASVGDGTKSVGRGMVKGKSSPAALLGRRLSHRTLRLLVGLLLPFLLVRTAFLALESAALCSSTIGCMTWRFFGGSDAAVLREELTRALVEAAETSNDGGVGVGVGVGAVSFKDLVKEVTVNRQDIRAFALKTKAMMAKMEHNVETAKWQESIYWHLAAHGVPKSLHCLSLRLAEEYAINAAARSRLPPPQYIHRLIDPSFHHVVLLTDNVLAASVVISSTIKAMAKPETLVFHVVTDKKTYTSMHAWFAVNTVDSAVVEVRGLHQYDWSHDVNVAIKEMLEIHHQIRNRQYQTLKMEDFKNVEEIDHRLHVLSPACISLLNHLRIYLPELFPELEKVVFLDDDIIIQRDISSLWELDLDEKVIGAVSDSWCGRDCCPGRRYKNYFNFTEPIISSNLDQNRCGWLYGVNVFDLKRWRSTNITKNLNSGFSLWHPGALPPALLAFENQMHRMDASWQINGLGYRSSDARRRRDDWELERAAALHFSGPGKPWLETGSPLVRSLWSRHVNLSNEHIRRCKVTTA
ncbi:probable galacturonosyltransferase 15 isoform X2 [Andrographis paniculata]|uniref:probable galacturonosyltransferase 15 isoform X2 n=1 Tax=Andrographis paniculata TaxID=175694 RepID=UPI0021E9267F|nr:probable galacturonosyltransferase 15 isoform X2 [Andrographis paniculata]